MAGGALVSGVVEPLSPLEPGGRLRAEPYKLSLVGASCRLSCLERRLPDALQPLTRGDIESKGATRNACARPPSMSVILAILYSFSNFSDFQQEYKEYLRI